MVEIQQVIGQTWMLQSQGSEPRILSVSVALAREQIAERTRCSQTGQVSSPQVSLERRWQGHESQVGVSSQDLGRPGIPLDVEVPVRPPWRKALGGWLRPPAHDHDRRPIEAPRACLFEEGEVGEGADTDRSRSPSDALTEEVERFARRGRTRGEVARPVAIVGRIRIGDLLGGQRPLGAGCEGNVLSTDQLKAMRDVGSPPSLSIDGRGDAHQLDPGPPEEHRQGASVTGVTAEVGIEMDPDRCADRVKLHVIS